MDVDSPVFYETVYLEKGKSMKVLELPSWYLPYGGHFVLHQALALREQGVDVHILANVPLATRTVKWHMLDFQRFPLRPFFTEEHGIPMLRYYTRTLPKLTIYNIRRWARITVALYEQYYSRYGHPDIIHAHSSTWGAYAASIIKKKWGIPYVVTEHRGMFGCKCELARDFFRPEFTPFLTEGLSNANYIIPVGDLLIPKLREYLTKDVPIKVISNIVDTDFFVSGSEIKPHNPFRWISVNGYRPVKGYDILLPAFDKICYNDTDVTLTLVGEDFEQDAFQELLTQCRHKDRIRFTGELNREGVLHELQQADAFVMSSRVESQSVAVLEALSCGLPIAGTEVIPSYTLPNNLGIRVPIERPDLLANAMQKIMDNYDVYSPIEAHDYIVNIANKNVVSKQLIEIYQEVLQNSRS